MRLSENSVFWDIARIPLPVATGENEDLSPLATNMLHGLVSQPSQITIIIYLTVQTIIYKVPIKLQTGELSKPQLQETISLFLYVIKILYYKILNTMIKNKIE